MKKIWLFLMPISVAIYHFAYADPLEEISKFSSDICDKINTEGEITRNKIEAQLEANAQGVAKLLGASVGANGKVIIDNEKHKGLPYDKLSEQMMDARACRKELAKMLIEQRNLIPDKKPVTFKTCRHPDFGQEGWNRNETITQASGWMDGGRSTNDWCNDLISRFLSSRAISVYKSQVLSVNEDARWTGIRHREYNYTCTVNISWDPLYIERTDPRCGTY